MLEKNADFNIYLNEIPKCFKDDGRYQLNLEDPDAQDVARISGWECGTHNSRNGFPNLNLVKAWHAWRGLHIQCKVLPQLMKAKMRLAEYGALQEENNRLRYILQEVTDQNLCAQ